MRAVELVKLLMLEVVEVLRVLRQLTLVLPGEGLTAIRAVMVATRAFVGWLGGLFGSLLGILLLIFLCKVLLILVKDDIDSKGVRAWEIPDQPVTIDCLVLLIERGILVE